MAVYSVFKELQAESASSVLRLHFSPNHHCECSVHVLPLNPQDFCRLGIFAWVDQSDERAQRCLHSADGSAGGGPGALGVRRWGSNNKVRASPCGQQGEAERLNRSLRLWLRCSDEHCRGGGGGERLSFHVHSLVCRYNLPLAKPLTLSLPLTPNEFNDNEACVCGILWIVTMHQNQKTCDEAKPCDMTPAPAYHTCTAVVGTLSGAPNIHQKQLRRNDERAKLFWIHLKTDTWTCFH
ncbi:uncharacterized protein LOC125318452 [Corvus hawaiiensis]|uniref:uncharacterized protein LOC125318452 n=1 Tax=Corvus hawaiiensis TaxID=134902 RepID=UPI002019DB13|nr:uncharacterized protein LOC125318452 [Corvus hawaiiensis]